MRLSDRRKNLQRSSGPKTFLLASPHGSLLTSENIASFPCDVLGKSQQGVDARGLSPNPVEHKRREKKESGRELLVTQEPSFGKSAASQ